MPCAPEAMDLPLSGEEEEFLRDLVPGDYIEAEYDGDDVAHERLLLWPVTQGLWVVHSPDADEWAEDIDSSDPAN